MSWLAIVQQISTFITGTFGTTLVTIAIAVAGARAMFHAHWGAFWSAIGGGAVLVSAAWVVQTFLGGAGG